MVVRAGRSGVASAAGCLRLGWGVGRGVFEGNLAGGVGGVGCGAYCLLLAAARRRCLRALAAPPPAELSHSV